MPKVIYLVNEEELRDALRKCGSVRVAAQYLGIHWTTAYRLMRRWNIQLREIVA